MQDKPHWLVFFVAVALIVVLAAINFQKVHGLEGRSWIFVSDCENVGTLADLLESQSIYAPYLGDYEVVCFPAAKDVMKVRQHVDMVRIVYPDDNIVFTYDTRNPAADRDFQVFMMLENDTGYPVHDPKGRAFIEEGFAVAVFNAEVVAHELAHLTLRAGEHCSTYNPAYWRATAKEC